MKLSQAASLGLLIALGCGVAHLARVGKASATRLSQLSETISVHASSRGNPYINLSDGRDVLTSYSGPAALSRALQQNLARPLALASADFDEDGVPDLICGYGHSGSGIISWLRGNVDSIYPNSPEAQRRKIAGEFTNAPFLSPARVFALPIEPEFLGVGDFDGDGHWDVVAASRTSDALYLLPGDGRGGFAEARRVALPGTVTAFVTGEINRRDGLDDIVVAVNGQDGPKALVFEGPEGALRAKPEAFDLPAEASALALGQLDDSYEMDLAVAAGRELMIVHGRDRRLSLDENSRADVPEAIISRRALPFTVRSLAIGDFSGNHKSDLALLSEDGAVRLLSNLHQYAMGIDQPGSKEMVTNQWPLATALICAGMSGLPGDDLVIVDSTSGRLHIVMGGRSEKGTVASSRTTVIDQSKVEVSLDVEGEPVAVLPMRLNVQARKGLVVLNSGHSRPSVVLPQSAMTFIVNTTDDHDDGTCDSGDCTLREAINAANANDGADTILFNIPGPAPHTITPVGSLPPISLFHSLPGGALTIDGTTQPGFAGKPIIELRGGGGIGLLVGEFGNGSTIRGLVINGFEIGIQSSQASILVESNFIGTDLSGTGALGGGLGIAVFEAAVNIGGTTPQARNIIVSGVSFSMATGGLVQGNYIGTDVNGTQALGNGGLDLLNDSGSNSVINNVVARGVLIDFGDDNTLQGNMIGTDVSGTVALGNPGDGVHVLAPGSGETIVGNVISGNGGNGIFMDGPSNKNVLRDNMIGTDVSGTQPLSNSGHGILIHEESSSNTIERNCVAFNNGAGVRLPFSTAGRPEPRFNRVLFNSIFSNTELGIDLGDEGVSPNDDKDLDSGPNDLQNFPVLTGATSDGTNTTVQGALNSTPGETFTIEFFSNPGTASSGIGPSAVGACIPQGQTFIGSITAATDANGNAPINIMLPSANPGGFINATATSFSGNTSEFSACVQPKFINADLSVSEEAPNVVVAGSDLSYQLTVANNGPELATNVVLRSTVPANTTLESLIAPAGWTSRLPDVGGAGSIICGTAGLYPGTAATFTIMVKVSPDTADGAIITSSVSVSSGIPDLKPGNNSVTVTTVVSLTPPPPPPNVAADLSLDLKGSPDSVFAGDAITYALTVSNLGPATARNVVLRQTVPVNTAFQTSTEVGGWSRDGPAVGGTGTITYTNTSLGSGGSATFTIVVKVNSDTPVGTTLLSAASVSSAADPNSGNNSLSVTTMTVARPPGPSVQSITVSSNITVVGSDFVKVQVFIDDIGFSDPAKVKGGTRVIQKGKLIDGRSIAEAVPPGRVVKIKFRNSNGGETEVSFRN